MDGPIALLTSYAIVGLQSIPSTAVDQGDIAQLLRLVGAEAASIEGCCTTGLVFQGHVWLLGVLNLVTEAASTSDSTDSISCLVAGAPSSTTTEHPRLEIAVSCLTHECFLSRELRPTSLLVDQGSKTVSDSSLEHYLCSPDVFV